MTAPLTLCFDPARPGQARGLAASLPASVQLAENAGEIALVDGQGDWPAAVEHWIASGAARVLVTDPDGAGSEALLGLIEAHPGRINISETHSDNPAAAEIRGWLDERFAVQTIAGQGDEPLAQLILQQLRIARATGLQGLAVDHAVTAPDSVVATLAGKLDGAAIALRLTAVRSAAGLAHHAWMGHAPDASASLTVYGGPAARPAQAMRMTAEGGYCPPTIYEHAHRASLRAMVAGAVDSAERLRGWVEDAALARTIAGRA